MLKLRYLAFVSILLLLISACGASEEEKTSNSTQAASINTGVKQVEEHIAQKQGMEQYALESAEDDAIEKTGTVTLVQTYPSTATATKSGAETQMYAQPTPERTSIYTIVMQNKYGQVAFNHAEHSQFVSCATCHPTEPPTRIDKNRKEFHALCRTCHQESGAGPIKCSGCHEH
ncbi:MAG: cytochrome c3 family protein [Desulfuromonadaceae bacterium]|nr:cytochrome c3 family protein [Desulfuromonadaceae bacterium]